MQSNQLITFETGADADQDRPAADLAIFRIGLASIGFIDEKLDHFAAVGTGLVATQ